MHDHEWKCGVFLPAQHFLPHVQIFFPASVQLPSRYGTPKLLFPITTRCISVHSHGRAAVHVVMLVAVCYMLLLEPTDRAPGAISPAVDSHPGDTPTHLRAETDSASFLRNGSYPGFTTFQAGQFSFWFSLPASLPSTAATTFCLVCVASRLHVQTRKAAAGWEGLKWTQA